jgi:GntR family transcriptional regulator
MPVDFMASNLGVFDDLTSKGHKVTRKTVEFYRCSPNETERRVFGVPAGGSVVRIRRIYFSDASADTDAYFASWTQKFPD